ncbi:hypothetical protein SRHO_G00266390 [Serrasalmus rhombeus]
MERKRSSGRTLLNEARPAGCFAVIAARKAAKMIHSLFLVNATGDIFLEKHWKSVVSRSVCDYFFEAQERATEPENIPPVIPTPHHYLIRRAAPPHLLRGCHSERGAASVRHRVSPPRRRHLPGLFWCVH